MILNDTGTRLKPIFECKKEFHDSKAEIDVCWNTYEFASDILTNNETTVQENIGYILRPYNVEIEKNEGNISIIIITKSKSY